MSKLLLIALCIASLPCSANEYEACVDQPDPWLCFWAVSNDELVEDWAKNDAGEIYRISDGTTQREMIAYKKGVVCGMQPKGWDNVVDCPPYRRGDAAEER